MRKAICCLLDGYQMVAETEALGDCAECGNIYAVYRKDEDWYALGTDGDCKCGNDEFTIISDKEVVDPA